MEIMFNIFVAVAGATGALMLIGFMLWALGWAVVQVFKWLKVWHVICLAVSIRLHGEEFADSQFWWAIKERASRSNTSARIISDYALEHAPTPRPQPASGDGDE